MIGIPNIIAYHEETKDKWIYEREPDERWLERKLYKSQRLAKFSCVLKNTKL